VLWKEIYLRALRYGRGCAALGGVRGFLGSVEVDCI